MRLSTRGRSDDLGCDRDGRLLGRLSAQVQADGGPETGDRLLRHSLLAQPVDAVLVRAPAPHGAYVAAGSAQRDLEQWDVELRVVRQHAQDGALVDLLGLEV